MVIVKTKRVNFFETPCRPNVCACRAYAINAYPAVCRQAAAIMHMIMNNLDHRVAQFPQELVTYGGNGQVFSNWAQASTVT